MVNMLSIVDNKLDLIAQVTNTSSITNDSVSTKANKGINITSDDSSKTDMMKLMKSMQK